MSERAADRQQQLRSLPSVDRLATAVARAELSDRRAQILAGAHDPGPGPDLVAAARARLRPSLRHVLNATGVILHTNLGRAPLSPTAQAAIAAAASGYCNLELDLQTGQRSARHEHIEALLCELTGAPAAIAVNNCAGAALLAVAALAGTGGEIVVSRGQLIEIGGGFRIPDIIAHAGARIVEVGTTNRTRLADYSDALNPDTAAILYVHQSNFRQAGFVEDVDLDQLCELECPVISDVGSGNLDDDLDLVSAEPSVRHSVHVGAAVTCFSADKLLGGSQAGLLLGQRDAIDACARHPLARALRIDKLSLAGLEATLTLYRDPEHARREIPALAMLTATADELLIRAQRLATGVGGTIIDATAQVGGGSLPLVELAGPVVALERDGTPAQDLAAALRTGDPPILARIDAGRVVLDPRTLVDHEVDATITAVTAVLDQLDS